MHCSIVNITYFGMDLWNVRAGKCKLRVTDTGYYIQQIQKSFVYDYFTYTVPYRATQPNTTQYTVRILQQEQTAESVIQKCKTTLHMACILYPVISQKILPVLAESYHAKPRLSQCNLKILVAGWNLSI